VPLVSAAATLSDDTRYALPDTHLQTHGSEGEWRGEEEKKGGNERAKKGGKRKRKPIGIGSADGDATTGFREPRVYIFIRATCTRRKIDAHIVQSIVRHHVTVTTRLPARKKEEDARDATACRRKTRREDFKMRAHAHAHASNAIGASVVSIRRIDRAYLVRTRAINRSRRRLLIETRLVRLRGKRPNVRSLPGRRD